MKIDKRNPRHWLILLTSGVLLLLALPFRLFGRHSNRVVLYGHKLNGNLLPFYEYGLAHDDMEFFYLSLDPEYLATLKDQPRILSGTRLSDLIKLVQTSVVITDHSLHHFSLLKKVTNIKFVDVWHGIPYKGFDETSFTHLHDYDEVWVSSGAMKQMYIDKFGFEGKKVQPVGYARVERLMHHPLTRQQILQKYHLEDRKTILIAPTWQQDDSGRSIVPFGLSLEEFIDAIAKKYPDDQVIFRAHLNVRDIADINNRYKNVLIMPYGKYPVGEDFLKVADVLISDWSSIVFDFLPLDRPVIYLDVKPPFRLGFSIGPEYRFGAVVNSVESLQAALEDAVEKPDTYQKKYKTVIQKTSQLAYGTTLDGKVMERSLARLRSLIKS